MSRKPSPDSSATKDHRASPADGTTTAADGGYAEKHGPRHDKDGWGEAHASQSDRAGTAEDTQGHAAGERSFDNGKLDPAAAEAASDAALREPGKRGTGDDKSALEEDEVSPGLSVDVNGAALSPRTP